jgi:hypothetical protein
MSFAPPGGTALVSVLSAGLAGVGDPEAVGVVAGVVDGHGWFSFVSVVSDASASIT